MAVGESVKFCENRSQFTPSLPVRVAMIDPSNAPSVPSTVASERWLVLCSTGLQFLSIVSLIEERRAQGAPVEVDLVLNYRRRQTQRIAEILPELPLFRKTFLIKDVNIPGLKHVLQDPEDFVPRFLGRFRVTRSLAEKLFFAPHLPKNYSEYTDFFVPCPSEARTWMEARLPEECRIHFYEDGIGSYRGDTLPPGIEDCYLFEPNLSTCQQKSLRRVPKLSAKSPSIRRITRAFCEGKNIQFPPVLYIDQAWGANALRSTHASSVQRAMWERRLELMDTVVQQEGVERCGILIHPGSKPDEVAFLRQRFGEETVIDLKGIPFEIALLHGIRCPEKIYTVTSSAAFYWKVACELPDVEAKMIFFMDSFRFDHSCLQGYPKILEKLRQRYPDLVEIR